MTKTSIAAPKKRYVITTMAMTIEGVKGRFYLVSARETKAGRTVRWDFDQVKAMTWPNRAGVDAYKARYKGLQGRISILNGGAA